MHDRGNATAAPLEMLDEARADRLTARLEDSDLIRDRLAPEALGNFIVRASGSLHRDLARNVDRQRFRKRLKPGTICRASSAPSTPTHRPHDAIFT
jgi:hypothetical protein